MLFCSVFFILSSFANTGDWLLYCKTNAFYYPIEVILLLLWNILLRYTVVQDRSSIALKRKRSRKCNNGLLLEIICAVQTYCQHTRTRISRLSWCFDAQCTYTRLRLQCTLIWKHTLISIPLHRWWRWQQLMYSPMATITNHCDDRTEFLFYFIFFDKSVFIPKRLTGDYGHMKVKITCLRYSLQQIMSMQDIYTWLFFSVHNG